MRKDEGLSPGGIAASQCAEQTTGGRKSPPSHPPGFTARSAKSWSGQAADVMVSAKAVRYERRRWRVHQLLKFVRGVLKVHRLGQQAGDKRPATINMQR